MVPDTADVQSVAISGNATRRLPIGNQDTSDGTIVPVSRNFDHFRDMRMNSLQSNYMTHEGYQNSRVTTSDAFHLISTHFHSLFYQVMQIIYTNYGSSLVALISAAVHSSGNGSKNTGNLSGKKPSPRGALFLGYYFSNAYYGDTDSSISF
ncbi:hypothetical protein Tco_1353134 [Tanacetum coccineum]